MGDITDFVVSVCTLFYTLTINVMYMARYCLGTTVCRILRKKKAFAVRYEAVTEKFASFIFF
jgi:hypothetical protein